MFTRLLVVAPHHDDETIGAGGLIARSAQAGCSVHVLAMSHFRGEDRSRELGAAMDILGATWGCLPYWDLAATPYGTLVSEIELAVSNWRPDAVVIPSPSAHQDHRVVHDACLTALRPSGGTDACRPEVVLTMEQPGDEWWASEARPLSVSLTHELVVQKCRAMDAYVTQGRPFPSERSTEALVALARLRGAQAGVPWAEAFGVKRFLCL